MRQELLVDDFLQGAGEQVGGDVERLAGADLPLGDGFVTHVGRPHGHAIDARHGDVAGFGRALGGLGLVATTQHDHDNGHKDKHQAPVKTGIASRQGACLDAGLTGFRAVDRGDAGTQSTMHKFFPKYEPEPSGGPSIH